MRVFLSILVALVLLGCNSDNSQPTPAPTPTPTPNAAWTFFYGATPGSRCDDFDFPGGDGVHYCAKQTVVLPGQTISMAFTVTGGPVLPVQIDDQPPATVRLFLWRCGDNLSGAGAYQQYRYWGTTVANLVPGKFTISVNLTPENWTDVYGQNGSTNPAAFAAALENLCGIGYTFGGQSFAGHGAYANLPAHFKLENYAVN